MNPFCPFTIAVGGEYHVKVVALGKVAYEGDVKVQSNRQLGYQCKLLQDGPEEYMEIPGQFFTARAPALLR